MFKVNIQSLQKENLSWSASFDTKEEAQSWLDKQLKKPNRLQEREVIIINDKGEEIVETRPAQSTYKIIDLSKDAEFIKKQAIQSRKAEYPSVEELLHVIADHGIDSQEWKNLQAKRQTIKEKYPKE